MSHRAGLPIHPRRRSRQRHAPSVPPANLYPGISKPFLSSLDAVAEAVMTMKRPVVLAGQGAISDSAQQAASVLAHRIEAPP